MKHFEKFSLTPCPRSEAIATGGQDGITLRAFIRDDDTGIFPDWLGRWSDTCAQPATFSFEHLPSRQRHVDSYGWFNAENVENREQARQNYDRACGYGESWVLWGVEVVAYKAGVELARSSVWGVESDCDETHLLELANDQASEALEFAKLKLKELAA